MIVGIHVLLQLYGLDDLKNQVRLLTSRAFDELMLLIYHYQAIAISKMVEKCAQVARTTIAKSSLRLDSKLEERPHRIEYFPLYSVVSHSLNSEAARTRTW
jgi:hypothetical protein